MNDYLQHYGIKGMKWGVRRFQNADGSLTAAGKKRYGSEGSSERSSKERKPIDGRKIAKGAIMAASVAGAAYLVARNRKAIMRHIAINATRARVSFEKDPIPERIARRMTSAGKNFKAGVMEGLDAAPRKMGRAMAEGAAYIVGSYAIGKMIGGAKVDDMIRSYNAYNKKNKVGKVTSLDDFISSGYYDDPDKDDED